MKNLIQQIKKLEQQSAALEPTKTQRADFIEALEEYAHTFISQLNSEPTYKNNYNFDQSLAIEKAQKSMDEVLKLYQTEVVDKGINAASGGHLGYIPGGGIFASALADFLAAFTNPYAGVYFASPGAVLIENEVINWLKSTFSFPETSIGNLTSGGSISTLIALTAARDFHHVKNERIPQSVVYLSEQVHHSTQKALRIIGLEDVLIRYIPITANHRMKADALAAQITADKEAGLHPFLVVATAGTTDTGAIDPLNEIAQITQREQLWFHVDAAYGGFFVLTSKKELFKGLEKADSLVIDPHKGLFLPYGLGAVLVKNKEALLHSNHYFANYMQDAQQDDTVLSPANISPELTKHFRGLRLWLPLQLHGVEPFKACLEEKLLLIAYFREKLQALGFSVGPTPDLSVSYFWFPFPEKTNENNEILLKEIHQDGRVFFSSTTINGSFVIRIAILSFRTKISTIDRALVMLKEALEKLNDLSA